MAKKKPDEGLTADELKEVETLEGKVQAEEAAEPEPVPEPAPVTPDPPSSPPEIEFPKMVKGRSFQTRAEQDAAGPEFAD